MYRSHSVNAFVSVRDIPKFADMSLVRNPNIKTCVLVGGGPGSEKNAILKSQSWFKEKDGSYDESYFVKNSNFSNADRILMYYMAKYKKDIHILGVYCSPADAAERIFRDTPMSVSEDTIMRKVHQGVALMSKLKSLNERLKGLPQDNPLHGKISLDVYDTSHCMTDSTEIPHYKQDAAENFIRERSLRDREGLDQIVGHRLAHLPFAELKLVPREVEQFSAVPYLGR